MATTSIKVKTVYIAGNSFSGSTLLGLVIGSDPNAFFGGEINQLHRINKNRGANDPDYRVCTCGKDYADCYVWGPIKSSFNSIQDFNPSPGFSLLNLKLMLKFLNPFFKIDHRKTVTEYGSLIETTHKLVRKQVKSAEYIVDSSKSVHNIYSLARSSNVDLHVLQIIRDGISVSSSFKKHGYSPLYGMIVWFLQNLSMLVFIKKIRPKILSINYERLCRNPDQEFKKINRFLGLDLRASDIVSHVRKEGYHLLGGNRGVTKFAYKIQEFEGIIYNDDRKILSKLELIIARVVLTPFNKLFLRNTDS